MDTATSDMGLDASSKNRAQTSKWRRLLSRRAKQESPKTEVQKQQKKATTFSPTGVEDVNHDQVSPATSKDEPEDNEEGSDNAVSSAPQPDDADAEDDDGENDSEDDEEDNDQDDDEDGEENAATRPLRDSWAEAWNSDELGEQRRALLEGRKEDQKPAQANSKKLVNGLIAKTPGKVASYTARWGSDAEKTALGRARSILVSALTVKDLIDAGLKFDPTGYGSAAWAVVSFGLTLVQNDKERVDLTFEACGHLADLMARYSRMEAHYWERKVKNGRPLEDAMVRVYTAILVYAAEVQGSIESSISTRIRKSFLSLTGQPLEDLRRTVDEENARLEEWQRQIDRERGDDAAKKLEEIGENTNSLLEQVDETAKTSLKTLSKANQEELRELYRFLGGKEGTAQAEIHKKLQRDIEWWKSSGNSKWKTMDVKGKGGKAREIATSDSSEYEEDQAPETDGMELEYTTEEDDDDDDEDEVQGNIPRELPPGEAPELGIGQGDELGKWLFQSREYMDWKDYPQGLLWLHGSSGCGKSPLCSTIINKLKRSFNREDNKTKVLAYWYFRYDRDETKRMDLLLVSLLRQLASGCKGFPDDKSLKWLRDHQDANDLPDDTKELFNHLKKFILNVEKDVFIVLDGLDHVPERQRIAKTGPLKVLNIIKRLARQGFPNLHILLASQDEKDIRSCLETDMKDMLVSVNVEQGLADDLDRLVEGKLNDMRILKGDLSLKLAVKTRLDQDQDRNFLWAASVLDQVSQCIDAEEVREALEKIPDITAGMYQAALEKVTAPKDIKRMKLILLWMLRQQRPLSPAELAAAVGLYSPTAVTDICTRVFIKTSKRSTIVAGQEKELDAFCFTHFSAQEYLEAVVSGSLEHSETKLKKMARFIFPPGEDAHFQMTRRCLDILTACSSSQWKKPVIVHISPGSDSDGAASGPDAGHSGNGTSSSSGTEDSDSDSEMDARTTASTADRRVEGPARRYAAEYWFRHYAMIDREKVPSRQLDELEDEICSQFLLNHKKLKFWLKTYDPDDGNDGNLLSPVYYAVTLGLDEILVRLIAQINHQQVDAASLKAVIDQRGKEGTALQMAAHLGSSAALDILVKHGADVNSQRGWYGTALYASAARGDVNTVEKLLEAGADSDGTDDGELGNPLHVAALRGHDAVVQLLLDRKKVAVNHRAGPFRTALQAACATRNRTTVSLLLDSGADPNIFGGYLGTAAQAAYTRFGRPGQDEIIEALLSKGDQFLDRPNFWATAYNRATSQGLERGADRASISEAYQKLLLRFQMPGPVNDELEEQQRLLAHVINQWTLPAASFTSADRVFRNLLCRVPFQNQLDDIKLVARRRYISMQDLRHKDFLHKGMFRAGINHIFTRLLGLIGVCLNRVRRSLRYGPEESSRVSASPSFPFRWAFREFENEYHKYDDDASARFHVVNQPERWRPPWDEQDDQDMMGSYTRSDLIAAELMPRRRRYKQLEEIHLLSNRYRGTEDAAAREELRSALQPGVWVTSDILDLAKDLLWYGDRCVRYQDAASDPADVSWRRHPIEDLTFELFSVVIRLALVLNTSIGDFERLAEPVRLLTVRFERIKQLDAMCERDFVPKSTCSHTSTENNSELEAQEIAAAVARQVEQTIEDKLAASQVDMVREIQSHVSGVVKEEISRLVGQMQQGVGERLYEIQRQLAEVQETQARRGLLW